MSADIPLETPARPKRGHAASVLICGVILIAAGFAAAYLAFARRVPMPGGSALGAAGKASIPSLAGLPRVGRGAVAWRPWGKRAFQDAAASRRLILLDLTSTWSHWSRLMDLTTYGDAKAAEWARGHVVAVRVDRDARPDLARRYGAAVPTTALLLPTGETLSDGAYIGPESFVVWAGRVVSAYEGNRAAILEAREKAFAEAAARIDRLLGPERDAEWKALSLDARRAETEGAVAAGLSAIGRADTSTRRFPSPAAHRLLFELMDARVGKSVGKGWVRTGDEVPARARRLLDGLVSLEDPVWGGLYRYSRCADWACPEREKLLSVQAAAIEDAAQASARGLGEGRRDLARRTAAFVEGRMKRDKEFYLSALSADVERPNGWVDGDRYYAAQDAERKSLGVPKADPAAYAAPHAELAAAYFAAGTRPAATAIIDKLVRATDREGRLRHRLDGPAGDAGLLDDQLAGARAALSAYRATREPRHLTFARKLLSYARSRLRDPASGGLRVRAPGEGPVRGWTEPVDPDQSAVFGLLLDDVASLSGAPEDAVDARTALDWALARPEAVDPVLRARVAVRWLRHQ